MTVSHELSRAVRLGSFTYLSLELTLVYFLQVNTYPGQRTFKAIGMGGGAFVDSMLGAVERVIGSPIHEESVNSRPSAKGSYISVTIGPVTVQNRDQVLHNCHAVLSHFLPPIRA